MAWMFMDFMDISKLWDTLEMRMPPKNKCPYFYPVCLMTEYPLPRECHVNNLNWFSRHKPLSGKNLVVNKVDFGSGLIQRIQCFEYKQSSLILKLYKIAFLRKTVLILAPVSNDQSWPLGTGWCKLISQMWRKRIVKILGKAWDKEKNKKIAATKKYGVNI